MMEEQKNQSMPAKNWLHVNYIPDAKEISIYGVDFSGAKKGKGTWIASGQINQGKLLINEIVPQNGKGPVERVDKLAQRMQDSPNTLRALDFPFSLPEQFAEWLMPSESDISWLALAESIIELELNGFKQKADDYIKEHHKEPLRCTEESSKGSFSSLHKVHPDMRPMTYYGIRLLSKVVSSDVHIPPIHPSKEKRLTILEVHPRSTLQYIFDDQNKWWGYKKRTKYSLRETILRRLEENQYLPVEIDTPRRTTILDSHDALDSLIACWTGALWLKNCELYHCPQNTPKIKLEGWIHKPRTFSPSN